MPLHDVGEKQKHWQAHLDRIKLLIEKDELEFGVFVGFTTGGQMFAVHFHDGTMSGLVPIGMIGMIESWKSTVILNGL